MPTELVAKTTPFDTEYGGDCTVEGSLWTYRANYKRKHRSRGLAKNGIEGHFQVLRSGHAEESGFFGIRVLIKGFDKGIAYFCATTWGAFCPFRVKKKPKCNLFTK